MRAIKQVADIIKGNIAEARKYALMAHELRDTNKPLADWAHNMAVAHLNFNPVGHSVVEKMIAEAKVKMKDSPYLPGMELRWDDDHKDLMRETAEVKSMTDTYGK